MLFRSLDFETYPTNGKPLITDAFFNRFQMQTETGETILEVDSEVKAEFVELLSLQKTYQLKIPVKEKVVEQIVKNYRAYISTLNEQLTANAKEKLHEWALAEKMAKEILEAFGVEVS